MPKRIIKNLMKRFKDRKKFKKDTGDEAQEIFKKTVAGGKRYYHPKNETRSDNIQFKRILKQVRGTREMQKKDKEKK